MAERTDPIAEALTTLRVTAGNIRSIGPAGALDLVPVPYRVWLERVEAAAALAEFSPTPTESPS